MAGKRIFAVVIAALMMAALAPWALAEPPMVVTREAVITDSGAQLRGAVISQNVISVTQGGFYYGTSRTSLSNKIKAESPTSPEYTLTNLTPGTTYYYQAYAVNLDGEALGEVVSFKAGASAQTPAAGSSGTPTDIQGYLDKIKAEFGLQIHYKNKRSEWNHLLSYRLVRNDAEALAGLKLIYTGLTRYPQEFIGKLKLKYIALAGEISTKDGIAATGVALGNTQQTMLLIQATTKESVMHHELFHAFEYAYGLRFADWDKANVKPNLYNENLKKTYDLLPPGFITRYALTMPEEDRAEIFMYMMTDALKDQLIDTAAHDIYLKDKIRRLNNTLDTNLGKIAQGSKWSATAQAAASAGPKPIKTVVAAPGAKLYNGPDTKEFSAVMDAPSVGLSVVQTGARWLKVLHEGAAYYIQTSDVNETPGSSESSPSSGANGSNNANGAHSTNGSNNANGSNNPNGSNNANGSGNTNGSNGTNGATSDIEVTAELSAQTIAGVAERLQTNHGISVSVNDTLTLYGELSAGAVRDLRGAAALAAEYEALLTSGVATPKTVKNVVICRNLIQGGTVVPVAMDASGSVLFLSQQAAGRLKGFIEALMAQL